MNKLIKVILNTDEDVIFILQNNDGYWFWVVDVSDFNGKLPNTLKEYEAFANNPENTFIGFSTAYFDTMDELESDKDFVFLTRPAEEEQ